MIWLVDYGLLVLRQDFEAGEGSFLLRLRPELVWVRGAFTRLQRAMRAVCKRMQDDDKLDRWIAEGFYYVPGSCGTGPRAPTFHGRSRSSTTTIAYSAWTI